MTNRLRAVRAKLREFALEFPETHEDLPWGERVVKVKHKVFAFLGRDMDAHFGLSVKLPKSSRDALALPFVTPTGYGLGKSGWVSAKFESDANPSLALLQDWVKESYCAVAPKSLAAHLQTGTASDTPLKTKAKVEAKSEAKAKTKTGARRAAPSALSKPRAKPKSSKS